MRDSKSGHMVAQDKETLLNIRLHLLFLFYVLEIGLMLFGHFEILTQAAYFSDGLRGVYIIFIFALQFVADFITFSSRF